ncbi:MAG TPA: pilus assembly protein TadG-related protein [Pyrinomonadaceae bacterium]|nr:pilus assembly protein TadG-related protein [Pyrinomonadaceae bacterium]
MTEDARNKNSADVAEPVSFARDERGQISVLVVLCVVPFVLLLAFIFNSGVQTSRKIEMQGAADAAAVASAVTVARGMNFMVLNNNAMAEVMSLMIAVRSIRNTANIMAVYVGIRAAITCAAAAACSIFCAPLILECEDWLAAEFKWLSVASNWNTIDSRINSESGGFGWTVLGILDRLNQISKQAFALWAGIQAREYAHKNGADLDPAYGFMLGGKSTATSILPGVSIPLPLPTFPLARGPEQAIAFRLEECQYEFLGKLNGIVAFYIFSIDPRRSLESVGLYLALRWANINHLKGDWGTIGTIFDRILGVLPGALTSFLGKLTSALGSFLGIELLSWKSNPPKPMLLTDNPNSSTTDEREIDEDTRNNLRPYLQYLGVALGRVSEGGRIGSSVFINKPNAVAQVQFTYAQADVYNPTKWDMWTQDWRAQLTRAKLFDQKVNDLLSILPIQSGLDWSFVNTH